MTPGVVAVVLALTALVCTVIGAIRSDCCPGEYGHSPNCKRRKP